MWWTASLRPAVHLADSLALMIAGACAMYGMIVAVMALANPEVGRLRIFSSPPNEEFAKVMHGYAVSRELEAF